MEKRPFEYWRLFKLALISLVVLLYAMPAGCFHGRPAGPVVNWMDSGEHPDYPVVRFVLGIGWGDTLKIADDRARGEVAKFFSAKVVSSTREQEIYRQSGEGSEAVAVHTFESKNTTRVRGSAQLMGVEIIERTIHNGSHYSLAVLDKAAYQIALEEQLARVVSEFDERLLVPTRPAAERIKALARALFLFHLQTQLVRKLSLVTNLHEFPAAVIRQHLNDELRELLRSNSPVVLSVPDELRAPLVEVLTGAGLVVSKPPAGVLPVRIDADMDWSKQKRTDLVEYTYTVDLSATCGGEVIARRTAAERIMHLTSDGARQKALLEIRKRVIEPFVVDLQRHLMGEFTNEEEAL